MAPTSSAAPVHARPELPSALGGDDAGTGPAAAELAAARRALGRGDTSAARAAIEAAVVRVAAVLADDAATTPQRRRADRFRAHLASHLLAAADIEAAGVRHHTVVTVLRRALDVASLEDLAP